MCPLQQLFWPPATSVQLQVRSLQHTNQVDLCQLLFFEKMAVSCESSLFWADFFSPAPTLHTARPIRLQHEPVGAPALRNHTPRPIRLQHGPVGTPALRNHTANVPDHELAPKLLTARLSYQPIYTREQEMDCCCTCFETDCAGKPCM